MAVYASIIDAQHINSSNVYHPKIILEISSLLLMQIEEKVECWHSQGGRWAHHMAQQIEGHKYTSGNAVISIIMYRSSTARHIT